MILPLQTFSNQATYVTIELWLCSEFSLRQTKMNNSEHKLRSKAMASQKELREALNDYVAQAQKSPRVTRSLRNWNCNIYFEATDIQAAFTMVVKNSQIIIHDGQYEQPDLIVRASSENLANIFWCDTNPASNYIQGAVKVQGSQDNVMRLDAMALLVYMEVNK
jgi:putative sterol carrier protein